MAGTQYLVDEDFIREFKRIRDKVDGAKGPGVRNTPQSLTFGPVTPPTPPPITPRSAVAFVRVQATEDGYGKYSGVLLSKPSAPTSIDDVVSQADLGDEGEACYIINALERDRTEGDNSGHDLSMIEGDRPKDFIALFLYNDPDDGTPTYGIVGFQVADCEDTNSLTI